MLNEKQAHRRSHCHFNRHYYRGSIGAGVLGIPYVIAKAGFLTGTFSLLALGIIVLLMYLYLGEIVLRTKGNHQLTGYAELYLGKLGKRLMFLTMVIGIYGALVAYLIGSSETLSKLLGGLQGNWLMAYFLANPL